MSHRTVINLLAGSLLCLGAGSCVLDGDDDDWGPAPTFTIGGTVAGASGPVALQNSNGTILIVASEGAFKFGTPMVRSALYNVTVAVPPKSQTCTVANGSGTVGSADIGNVNVICAPAAYMLGRR
ncbi:MAG TPA: hypothetical protein VFU13_08885 [Steroidobacteraceae bacterium]|nr:hypothetical protein [Steroidobacteraceae bacterium]